METELKPTTYSDGLNILLIGNNPIEMSGLLSSFTKIRNHKIIAEIAFDLKSLGERLSHFHPHYILIDDNIGKLELRGAIKALAHYKRTKGVPITVLKNSNYEESGLPDVLDYVLKKNFSADALLIGLKNSLKFKRTQQYLQETYKKRKQQLLRLSSR